MGSVVIVGTGLVGASVGLALTAAGEQVHLADRVRSHSMVAAGLGAGTIEPPVHEEVSLVVVAVPPDVLPEVIAQALVRFPNATVTDVGSVKAPIVAQLLGAEGVERYVPSHPMAGSQYTGPLTADARLFVDRTWVVAAHPRNSAARIAEVVRLAEMCGARVVQMDPEEHDQAVAQVSHLPHLMSILMAGHLQVVPPENLQLAGQGVRDVTRIAGSDPGLWRQILGANSVAVRAELEAIRDDLSQLMSVLDDPPELERFLSGGRAGALSLGGKHGLSPQAYGRVVVEIPDEPNSLAKLFTDVGDLGVNVEDVSIEHDETRQVGYLAIEVLAAAAPGLQSAIVERGWRIRSGT